MSPGRVRILAILGVLLVVALAFVGGLAVGRHSGGVAGGDQTRRDFMFQVLNVRTPNQGGHTLNLFLHYRYNAGITDPDITDYTKVRTQALTFLNTADLSHNPYWEVLNHRLCAQLKASYPIQAISCELQVIGVENPAPHDEPGYRASVETIGDIEPLAIPGPLTPASSPNPS